MEEYLKDDEIRITKLKQIWKTITITLKKL